MGDKINQDVLYKFGDIVLFNSNKDCGFIIEVNKDCVRIVGENGTVKVIRLSEIDKKHLVDRKASTRDSKGNAIQLEDAVKMMNK
jgi:transcription elongation factor